MLIENLSAIPVCLHSSWNNSELNPGEPLIANYDGNWFNVYNLLYNLVFAMNDRYQGSVRNTDVNLKGPACYFSGVYYHSIICE